MAQAYRHILVRCRGNVFCVRLRTHQLSEVETRELGLELSHLIEEGGCSRLALSLGPGDFPCLYSILLAELVMARRRLVTRGGRLRLCDVSPEVLKVLQVCQLHRLFDISPDLDTAVADLSAS